MLINGILFQIGDFHQMYNSTKLKTLRHPQKEWNNPLKSKIWLDLGEQYNKVKLVPPLFCEKEAAAYYIPFSYFAANHKMSINSFYLARYNYDASNKNCQKLFADVRNGMIDPDSVYILNNNYLNILKSNTSVPIICEVVDGFNVCISGHADSIKSYITKMENISPL